MAAMRGSGSVRRWWAMLAALALVLAATVPLFGAGPLAFHDLAFHDVAAMRVAMAAPAEAHGHAHHMAAGHAEAGHAAASVPCEKGCPLCKSCGAFAATVLAPPVPVAAAAPWIAVRFAERAGKPAGIDPAPLMEPPRG